MFYTYILYSHKDEMLYHGHTKDLQRRFLEHTKGLVSATHYRRPLTLVYYEAFLAEKDAIEKEAYYKTGPGRKFINKHLPHSLEKIRNSK